MDQMKDQPMAMNPESDGAALQLLVTIDNMVLPGAVDGRNGTNRASGNRAQIRADNDVDAIKAWLARFLDTKTTFDNYRKEAERLLLWATVQSGKALSSLTHEDMLAYQHFLSDPQPVQRWVMRDGRRFGRADPEWRPFAGALSPASGRQAMVILNVLFSWLVHAGYLAGNPLSLSRQRGRRAAPRITRYLEEDLWIEVKRSIDAMPQTSTRERDHHARLRWLFSLLYLCGLRISEVVGNTMGDFFCRRESDGTARWWLEILGKGDKLRLIPASDELMAELARYRVQLGLLPGPLAQEATPLLLPIAGKARALTRGAVHAIVKQVFEQAAERFRLRGAAFEPQAQRLLQASAHWLRHTAGSHMANSGVDLRHVRDNLGHESISTTSNYLHSSDDKRHAETQQKHRIDW
jgi:site-specific recombinase XerD